MDLFSELEKLTEPLFKAGPVRSLSRDEIIRLEAEGSVTPPGVPSKCYKGRTIKPENWERGGYFHYAPRRLSRG